LTISAGDSYDTPGRNVQSENAEELASFKRIALICGHYEGVDERVRMHLVSREISVGDFVLTGGELSAMIIVDAVARLVPGVLGNAGSAVDDSFSTAFWSIPIIRAKRVQRLAGAGSASFGEPQGD